MCRNIFTLQSEAISRFIPNREGQREENIYRNSDWRRNQWHLHYFGPNDTPVLFSFITVLHTTEIIEFL